MMNELKAIRFIESMEWRDKTPIEIEELLVERGYVGHNGKPFERSQVNSLLHSVREQERKKTSVFKDRCGIDRASNPCGDASDY